MLSKNVQGFCFFLYFPKQSTKLIINLKSLKIPEAKQLLLRVGRTMFNFFKNVILLIVTEMTFMCWTEISHAVHMLWNIFPKCDVLLFAFCLSYLGQ